MYISKEEYAAIYDPIDDEKIFTRLAYDACRTIDRLTAGADGIKKLKVAFPTDEDSAETVKHCTAHIVHFLYQIQEAEKSASMGRGYEQTEGGLRGRVITNVSAGNESVSYSASQQQTAADLAIMDAAQKERTIREIVKEYLSGVADANGVNLLYMGLYPVRR
jgi:hypothetical protein